MRTTVTLLSQEQDEGIFMDSYSTVGFKLNSGIRIMGPCVVFPRSVLQWNVSAFKLIFPYLRHRNVPILITLP